MLYDQENLSKFSIITNIRKDKTSYTHSTIKSIYSCLSFIFGQFPCLGGRRGFGPFCGPGGGRLGPLRPLSLMILWHVELRWSKNCSYTNTPL